jgi:putative glutamine amidotransferase
MRPLIAVAGQALTPGRVKNWREDSVGVPANYIRALHRAGGQEAILLPEPIDEEEAAERLEPFDGLMLLGGSDVDPAFYGQEPAEETYGIDPDADRFELALVRTAIERGMPVLGICRGLQLLNVALGGSLDQHITGREGLVGHGIPGVAPDIHEVHMEPGTWTAKALRTDTIEVSSSHHQALARLAEGLVASGRAPDGIVEAVERPGDGWVVAVQWHPERSAEEDPSQQGLFNALVEQAKRA